MSLRRRTHRLRQSARMLVIAARAAIDDDNRDGPRVTRQDLLVLVRTTPVTQALAPEDHVQIDWGDDFAASYQAAFPDQPNAVLSICTAGWRLIVFWRPAAAVFQPGFHRPCLEERRLARSGQSGILLFRLCRPFGQGGCRRHGPNSRWAARCRRDLGITQVRNAWCNRTSAAAAASPAENVLHEACKMFAVYQRKDDLCRARCGCYAAAGRRSAKLK